MNGDKTKVVELFTAALELSPGPERDEFLQEACESDEELHRKVRALLAALTEGEITKGKEKLLTPSVDLPETLLVAFRQTEGLGTVIDRYKLLEQIGEGGMGTVWMAEQIEPVQRRVALKVIKPGMDSSEVLARFEVERQALALMDHANIAKVLDAGATDTGRPYFVMELVKGIPITTFCDEKQLSIRERLELFIPVCQAIQHAHQKGVIHRDIKPSNVLVALYDGKPIAKVIDFGIAKATGQRLTQRTLFTERGVLIGTLQYMSPEQAELNQFDIDTRSDIYSLGVLLYELLTGSTPLTREAVRQAAFDEILRRVREDEPPKPSTRLTDSKDRLPSISTQRKLQPPQLTKLVRGDLDWIVMKALEKNRTRRYETANALAQDIENHLRNEPVSAGAPGVAYRARKFVLRHKVAVMAAFAVTAALIIGLGLATWEFFSERKSRQRAEKAEETQSTLRQQAQASERKATEKLWDAYLAQARANRRTRETGHRFDTLAILAQAAEIRSSVEVRNEAIACLTLRDLRLGHRWVLSRQGLRGFAIDSNFERCALIDEHEALVLRGMEAEGLSTRLGGYGTNVVWGMRFSPGDKYLAVIYGSPIEQTRTCQLWNLERKAVALTLTGIDGSISTLDFSADDRLAAMGDRKGTIKICDLASGQVVQTLSVSVSVAELLNSLSFDPGGDRLAIAKGSIVEVWELKSGKPLQTLPHAQPVLAVAWHPSGASLAAGSVDNRVYLWDIATGQTRMVMEGHKGIVTHMTFSHTGDLLASSSVDYTVRLWDPTTGSELVSHQAPGTDMQELKFSRNDQFLAYAWDVSRLGSNGFFEVASGNECRTMRYDLQQGLLIPSIYFSPDGRWLTVVDRDGLRFWDAATSKFLAFVPSDVSWDNMYPLQGVAFHPRGGLLVSGSFALTELPMAFEEQQSILRIGPLGQDPESATCFHGWIDQQGDRFAVGCHNGHVLLLDEKTRREQARFEGSDRASPALSADGQWLAIGDVRRFSTKNVRVFHLPATNIAHTLPVLGRSIVRFSPDSKWLVAGRVSDFEIYRTGSWQLAYSIPATNGLNSQGIFCFSPDSRILAIASSDFHVRLVDLETSEELATLAPWDPQPIAWLVFNPNGTQLAAVTLTHQIQLWDLPALRTQLAALKLDWRLPPLPDSPRIRFSPARAAVNTNTVLLQNQE